MEKVDKSCLTCVFITMVTVFFTFLLGDNTMIFAETDENTQHQQQNATLALTDYNFIATGDWYVMKRPKRQ